MTPKYIGFFSSHREIIWPSLLKIQYTEPKLSYRNNHVVNNYIYSNCDLDLLSNDPKINRVLPHAEGNHEVKFCRDLIYKTNAMRIRPCCQKIY
jgi:hypothetical protein